MIATDRCVLLRPQSYYARGVFGLQSDLSVLSGGQNRQREGSQGNRRRRRSHHKEVRGKTRSWAENEKERLKNEKANAKKSEKEKKVAEKEKKAAEKEKKAAEKAKK